MDLVDLTAETACLGASEALSSGLGLPGLIEKKEQQHIDRSTSSKSASEHPQQLLQHLRSSGTVTSGHVEIVSSVTVAMSRS